MLCAVKRQHPLCLAQRNSVQTPGAVIRIAHVDGRDSFLTVRSHLSIHSPHGDGMHKAAAIRFAAGSPQPERISPAESAQQRLREGLSRHRRTAPIVQHLLRRRGFIAVKPALTVLPQGGAAPTVRTGLLQIFATEPPAKPLVRVAALIFKSPLEFHPHSLRLRRTLGHPLRILLLPPGQQVRCCHSPAQQIIPLFPLLVRLVKIKPPGTSRYASRPIGSSL